MPTLESLQIRHQEHQSESQYWALLSNMIAGGNRMKEDSKRQLLVNPDGRPDDVMRERVRLATYINKIGPVLNRFVSQLCAKQGSYKGSTDEFWATFFKERMLLPGDDDGRANFHALLSTSMFEALSQGKAIAQVDTRRKAGSYSIQAQKENGELNPYVVLHPREALWDWEISNDGFDYTKLHQFKRKRLRWNAKLIPIHEFTIYERIEDDKIFVSKYSVTPSKDEVIGIFEDIDLLKEEDVIITTEIEDELIFSFNGKFKFPVVTLTLPEKLWVGSQLYEPQKSFFNQTAALEWGIFTSNFAMPVINGIEDEDDNPLEGQRWGDGYYLLLRQGQTLSWTERPGGAFSTALNYRGEIKRDIFDTLQQIAMSASDGTAIIARSGESKREDRRPEQILLETYGQMLCIYAGQILDCAAIAHAEDIAWDVKGFNDFLNDGILEYIAEFTAISQAPIPSKEFKKETTKHYAGEVLRGIQLPANQVGLIMQELDKADYPLQPAAPPQ